MAIEHARERLPGSGRTQRARGDGAAHPEEVAEEEHIERELGDADEAGVVLQQLDVLHVARELEHARKLKHAQHAQQAVEAVACGPATLPSSLHIAAWIQCTGSAFEERARMARIAQRCEGEDG